MEDMDSDTKAPEAEPEILRNKIFGVQKKGYALHIESKANKSLLNQSCGSNDQEYNQKL